MAPIAQESSPSLETGGFSFANATHQMVRNEPEVIEILDDDDDEIANEATEESDLNSESDVTGDDEDEDEEEYDDGAEESEDVNGTDSATDGPSEGSANSNHGLPTTTTTDLFTSAGVQLALNPLRRTADRVTRQMQVFAEKLDRFKQREYHPSDIKSFQAAYSLAKDYQKLAQDCSADISRQNTLRRAKADWNASRDSASGTHPTKIDEELRRLQLESDTWGLLLDLISIDDPVTRLHAREAQETAFQNLHRYSSDREVWEQFLDADHFAAECMAVMKWLQTTDDISRDELESLISDFEAEAERGQGLWAHGWLYTKETIKGQKRLRSWPQPLEPDDPGITLSLLSSEKREPLITQLDPDAVIRQKQALQKQDRYYEQATWLTCWKMLRYGESWTTIRKWSEARLESWRAVSLCGSSVDVRSSAGKTAPDDGMTRMMNCRSQESWRAACSALARNPNIEDFERAVYALLCGETEPAYKICQTWDDFLYVFYNHILLSRYQEFCKQFHRKLDRSPTSNVAFVPQPASYNEIRNFLENVKTVDRISVEGRNPYRTIQAAILSKNYDPFFLSLANAASKVANIAEKSDLIPDISPVQVAAPLMITARDRDSIRIAAHLYIIARSLGYTRIDSHFTEAASTNVIGYIESLRRAEMLELVPIYASILPAELAHTVLGRVLIEVIGPAERRKQAMLLEKHKIDLRSVLKNQWHWILSDTLSKESRGTPIRLSRTLSHLEDGSHVILPIKTGTIGMRVSQEDERAIRCLEWHKYIDGPPDPKWTLLCELATRLYKRFYSSNHLAAAMQLANRMRIKEVSREIIGYDIFDQSIAVEDGLDNNLPQPATPTTSPSKHRRRQSSLRSQPSQSRRMILWHQGSTISELERIITTFDALEKFQLAWDQYEDNDDSQPQSVALSRQLKDKIQEALDHLDTCIDLLFEHDVLMRANDETEAGELEFIRHTYLPELIINYHHAYYFASVKLSQDALAQCLRLSTIVAGNPVLVDSFMGSGRMCEFVDSLALSSGVMVNASGVPMKIKKRLPDGGKLDIWNISLAGTDENPTPL